MQSAQSTEGKHSLTALLTSMIVLLELVLRQGLIFFFKQKPNLVLTKDKSKTSKECQRLFVPLASLLFWQELTDLAYAIWLSCLGILVAFKQSMGPCIWLPSLVPAEQLPNVLKLF